MKKPSKDALMIVAGAIGGAVAGKIIVSKIPLENDLIKALIPIGAGVVLSSQKSPILKGVGYGMAAVGGLTLVDALAPGMLGAPAVEEDIFLGEVVDDEINGYYDEDGNFIEAPENNDYLPEHVSDPADQSILSDPADQSILSGASNAQAIADAFDLED